MVWRRKTNQVGGLKRMKTAVKKRMVVREGMILSRGNFFAQKLNALKKFFLDHYKILILFSRSINQDFATLNPINLEV